MSKMKLLKAPVILPATIRYNKYERHVPKWIPMNQPVYLNFTRLKGFWTLLSWPLLMCLCLSYHFGDVFEAHGSDQFALDLIRISNPLEWIGIRVGKCWFLDTDVATSLYGPGYYAIAGCATPNNATDRALWTEWASWSSVNRGFSPRHQQSVF